jgi:hypothetical protein
MHLSHDEYKRLDNITESEEEWKDCEIPSDYYLQQMQQQEDRKAEEDPKTLAMTSEIMSPTKMANVEESGYIGGKSSDEPRHAIVEDQEEVSINLILNLG